MSDAAFVSTDALLYALECSDSLVCMLCFVRHRSLSYAIDAYVPQLGGASATRFNAMRS